MPRPRYGFTVIELAMVVALMGLVTAMSIPRITAMRESAAMRSTKQEIASTLARARSLAVQRGQTVRVVRDSSGLEVVTTTAGVELTLLRRRDFYSTSMVALDGVPEIAFDARGSASGIAGMAVIRLDRGALADSVCVVRTGKILSHGCLP